MQYPARIVLFALQLSASIHCGDAAIVSPPVDQVAAVGDSIYFNCSTSVSNEEIHWFHYKVGSLNREFVYGYDQFYSIYQGRYQIQKDKPAGVYNLIIPGVQIGDAGKYECQDDVGRGAKSSAHLTVLETQPVCESNINVNEVVGTNNCGIKEDQLILSCTVQFKGDVAPNVAWKKAGDNETISEGITGGSAAGRSVYNLTLSGGSIENGSFYICQVKASASSSTNCKSGVIKVIGTAAGIPVAACQCKPYIDAIICILFLLFPIFIGGSIAVGWFLHQHRLKRKSNSSKDDTNKDTAAQQMVPLNPDKSQGEAKSKQLQEKIQNKDKQIAELQKQIIDLKDKSQGQQQKINEQGAAIQQKDELIQQNYGMIRQKDERIASLTSENQQLLDRVQELEHHLYPSENIEYAENPKLVQTIATKEEKKAITGMTILDNDLLILHEESSEVEVYDSKTFIYEVAFTVQGLGELLDIASCNINKCVFVIGRPSTGNSCGILRLDSRGKCLNDWSVGGYTGRLTTFQQNVIVCLYDKQRIEEYTIQGTLVHTVRLSPAANLIHPHHALKVTSVHYLVSHGDVRDDLHRVCIVNAHGDIVKACETVGSEWGQSKLNVASRPKMNVPICLSEDGERSILVGDRDHSRVLLLSSALKYQRKIVHATPECPVRLCLDAAKGLLFVAGNKWSDSKGKWRDGRIFVYSIK